MALPRRFRHLHELRLENVPVPDDVWLVFAVCATTAESCGWGGWILEDARRLGEAVSADTEQRCPRCGALTFRTLTRVQYSLAADQSRARAADREATELEYDD